MAKLGELVGELQLNIKNWKASLYGARQDIEVFGKDFDKAALISSVAIAGMTVAMEDFAVASGRAQALAGGFARNFSGDMQENLAQLRAASKGTVSDVQLMQTANKAALLGVTDNVDLLSAAFTTARLRGKEMGLTATEAIDNLVTGVGRGSPLILDNLGIFIPDALKKMQGEVDQATYKQLLFAAVLEDGQSIYQQYGEDAITAADRSEQMKATLDNMKVAVGGGLVPVFEGLLQVISPLIATFSVLAQTNPNLISGIAKLALTVTTVVVAFSLANKAGVVFLGVLKLIKTGAIATQLTLGILGVALIALGYLFAKAYADASGFGAAIESMGDPFENLLDYFKKAGNASDEFADKTKERVAEIKEAIAEEQKSYQEQLADIVRTKRDQIKAAQDALKKEEEDFRNSQDKLKSDYDKRIEDQKAKNQSALKDLELSMKKSVVVGSSTYNQDLKNYNKLALEKELEGQKLLDGIKSQYEEDTAKATEEYKKKTSELQKTIDENTAMLEKHRNDIKNINLSIQKDDIQILKETHEKRMKQLNKQLQDERNARKTANGQTSIDFQTLIDEMNKEKVDWNAILKPPSTKEVFKEVKKEIGASLKEIFDYIFKPTGKGSFIESYKKSGAKLDFWGTLKDMFSNPFGGVNGKPAKLFNAFGTSNFKGGRTIVGERGPEEVILPPGSQIIPNNQMSSNGSTNNFTFNQVIDKSVDVDAFNYKQAFILSGLI